MKTVKDTIIDLVLGLVLFSSLCAIFSFGYVKGRQDEKKEQEKLAVQAGIGYYHVDQIDGTLKFKYNF